MIRINLLKNTAGTSNLSMNVNEMTGIDLKPMADEAYVDPKEIVIRVLIVLLFPLVIFGVDTYLVSIKNAELDQINQQIATAQAKIDSYGQKADSVKKFKQEREGLQSRIDIIKKLSIEGNYILKRLDALHSVVPQKAWLTALEIDDTNFTMEALATDDFVVSTAIQNFSENIYFSAVRMESTSEVEIGDGVARKFKVKGQVNTR